MKAWILIVGILVIFAILFSPVLAISKLDLIAFYKGEPAPDMKPSVFIHNFTTPLPTPTPTPYIPSAWAIPTPVPSSAKSLFPSWFISPSVKPTVSPTPISPPSSSTSYPPSCPPAIPIRYLEHTWCECMAYRNVITGEVVGEECINPDTGQRYPIGKDALGNLYIVKPECPIKWID